MSLMDSIELQLRDLACMLTRFLQIPTPFAVLVEDGHRFIFKANFHRIDLDQRRKHIIIDRQFVAEFSKIASIEVRRRQGGKGVEWWTIELATISGKSLHIARSMYEPDISMILERLVSLTGFVVNVNKPADFFAGS